MAESKTRPEMRWSRATRFDVRTGNGLCCSSIKIETKRIPFALSLKAVAKWDIFPVRSGWSRLAANNTCGTAPTPVRTPIPTGHRWSRRSKLRHKPCSRCPKLRSQFCAAKSRGSLRRHETEILRRELREIWEDRREIGSCHAEP